MSATAPTTVMNAMVGAVCKSAAAVEALNVPAQVRCHCSVLLCLKDREERLWPCGGPAGFSGAEQAPGRAPAPDHRRMCVSFGMPLAAVPTVATATAAVPLSVEARKPGGAGTPVL